jgi:hypothetical protein
MKRITLAIAALLACTPVYAQRIITKGATDQSVYIRIIDAADGTPETGVTSATGGIDLEYTRAGAAPVDLTESDLAATSSTHSDGGIKHIGGGIYRVDLPDAACATGVASTIVGGTVTDMIVIPVTVQLTAFDLQSTTALSTQASVDEIIATIGTPTDTDIATDIANNALTDNDIAGAVWGALRASYATVNTFGEYAPANVTRWLGTAAATPTTAGVPEVDVTHWIGTAAATPTTAGVPEVDITHFNGVAGTFASGRPEVNTSHLAGTAYATASATLVDNVWDEALAGHATAGSAGAGLSAAQSAGDPWSTAIPGAYSAGTAGYIVGTNLDAAVSAAGGATAVDADIVGDSYTWIGKRYRAQNIVEVGDNFDGTLALKPDMNPNTTILTVDSVSITGAAVVTATDLEVDRSRTIAHFTVPTLTTTGTYTVVVTVTTIDGMTIPTTCTLKVY